MLRTTKTNRLTKGAIAGVMAFSAVGLSACGNETSGSEAGTDVADIQEEDAAVGPYNGLYDSAFFGDINSYEGQEVTVSADVNEVLSPTSFTIAGTEDTSVEALLVVSADENNTLEPGSPIQVTGTVQKAFDLPTAEEDLGVDMDDELFDAFDGEPYIVATNIDTTVSTDSNNG